MKITTFNIRCKFDTDGINSFVHRAGFIFHKIQKEKPDVIAFQEVGFTAAFMTAFTYHALTIGAGQVLACYGLGMLLLSACGKVKWLRRGR